MLDKAIESVIGKGTRRRMYAHLNNSHNRILNGKIKHIKDAGHKPEVMKIMDGLTVYQACNAERILISIWGRIDNHTGTLCNLTDGGEGTVGFRHSQETLKLFSEQRKNKKQTPAQLMANKSRKPTQETRARISAATRGHRWHTPEQIAKIKEVSTGRKHSEETKRNWSIKRKGVKQTDEHIRNVIEAKRLADLARRASMTDIEYANYHNERHRGMLGKRHSEDEVRRMKLRRHTEESKQKMRDSYARRKNK